MPLTSFRGSEFIHHEIPGIKLSDEVLQRMKACQGDKVEKRKKAFRLQKNCLIRQMKYFNGIYLITPFLRYEMTVQLNAIY